MRQGDINTVTRLSRSSGQRENCELFFFQKCVIIFGKVFLLTSARGFAGIGTDESVTWDVVKASDVHFSLRHMHQRRLIKILHCVTVTLLSETIFNCFTGVIGLKKVPTVNFSIWDSRLKLIEFKRGVCI